MALRSGAPTWFPDWSGRSCVIVACGPSAANVDLTVAFGVHGLKWIVIKNSWRLNPDADVLYGCDRTWWQSTNGATGFRGLKISQNAAVQLTYPNVKIVKTRKAINDFVFDKPGEIGWGSNSGFQAINLALQFGARKIIGVGFDCSVEQGAHWHSETNVRNPTAHMADRWRKCLDRQKSKLDAIGAKFVVCGRSSLTAYPKMDFMEAVLQ